MALIVYDLRDHNMLLVRCDVCHSVFDSDAQACVVCRVVERLRDTIGGRAAEKRDARRSRPSP